VLWGLGLMSSHPGHLCKQVSTCLYVCMSKKPCSTGSELLPVTVIPAPLGRTCPMRQVKDSGPERSVPHSKSHSKLELKRDPNSHLRLPQSSAFHGSWA
jgi:hypothetical protein